MSQFGETKFWEEAILFSQNNLYSFTKKIFSIIFIIKNKNKKKIWKKKKERSQCNTIKKTIISSHSKKKKMKNKKIRSKENPNKEL